MAHLALILPAFVKCVFEFIRLFFQCMQKQLHSKIAFVYDEVFTGRRIATLDLVLISVKKIDIYRFEPIV